MKPSVREWTRPWAGVLAVVVGVTLAASPALAGQAPAPGAPKSLRAAALSKAEALGSANAVTLAPDTTGAGSAESGRSFFKSKKGAAALILMAGAFAWAIVSRKQDAVHSPAR